MPQMAPMNWVTLFIMFSIILLMVNSINYFSFFKAPKTTQKNKLITKTNWKW
uniref:ATP synthase complex subunit 8 n=2 Tax=Dermestidae TaxID=41094 RepID=A0A3G6IJL6_9COLE|nr:ATP synthase F0 subunit 8 [Anthrenus verbasci]QOW08060.1 ATP synthase F0 subunit 8 [Attagenus unicolor japonicus]UZT67666.1 ATP synthase F0 subunit 8 [Attagenus unicolor japonicus]